MDCLVTCELCQAQSANFNRHMRLHHPGCGGRYTGFMLSDTVGDKVE